MFIWVVRRLEHESEWDYASSTKEGALDWIKRRPYGGFWILNRWEIDRSDGLLYEWTEGIFDAATMQEVDVDGQPVTSD